MSETILALPAPAASDDLTIIDALPASQNPAAVYIASLADGSRRTMIGALNTIAAVLTNGGATVETYDWTQLRYQQAAFVRAELSDIYKFNYTNKILSALRGVAREAWRLNHCSGDELAKILDVKNVSGKTTPSGRSLDAGEIYLLCKACEDGTALGARDAALISMCYGAGLRRSEAVDIDVSDFSLKDETLLVRSGKGNADRIAPLAAGGAAAIQRWLELRPAVEGDSPLLLPFRRWGVIEVKRMSDQAVLYALSERAKLAGIDSFSPHDLRRTFAGDLMDAGIDISLVQQLMGHALVTTTQRYDRRPDRLRAQAVRQIRVPFTQS